MNRSETLRLARRTSFAIETPFPQRDFLNCPRALRKERQTATQTSPRSPVARETDASIVSPRRDFYPRSLVRCTTNSRAPPSPPAETGTPSATGTTLARPSPRALRAQTPARPKTPSLSAPSPSPDARSTSTPHFHDSRARHPSFSTATAPTVPRSVSPRPPRALRRRRRPTASQAFPAFSPHCVSKTARNPASTLARDRCARDRPTVRRFRRRATRRRRREAVSTVHRATRSKTPRSPHAVARSRRSPPRCRA